MKKNLIVLGLCLIGLTLGLTSCDKYSVNYDIYKQTIVGTWIAVDVDGEEVETDKIFINVFNSNGTSQYASIDEVANGKEWLVVDGEKYRLDNDILFEETEYRGTKLTMKSSIRIEGDYMYVQEIETTADGVKYPANGHFTMKRVTNDLKNQLVGIWKGNEITEGVAPSKDKYWEFLPNGNYYYYYFDEATQKYVRKADNDGKFFLYGDFLASNYSNDLLSGAQGRTSECWKLYFNNDGMSWTGKRAGGKKAAFYMKKVNKVE
ncbi:hypothetical protein LJC35_03085 [Parabacteroides sp. OttesenSCG-928-N08]|nr:hypothetical protein [Parabacteroides sp. OttesenSCG-928-N08]